MVVERVVGSGRVAGVGHGSGRVRIVAALEPRGHASGNVDAELGSVAPTRPVAWPLGLWCGRCFLVFFDELMSLECHFFVAVIGGLGAKKDEREHAPRTAVGGRPRPDKDVADDGAEVDRRQTEAHDGEPPVGPNQRHAGPYEDARTHQLIAPCLLPTYRSGVDAE